MRTTRRTPPWAAAACLLWALAAAAAPARSRPKKPPARDLGNKGHLFLDARGLRPDSPRIFSVWQDRRCIAYGRAGKPLFLPPGQYDVRVGFGSGWLTTPVALEARQRHRVATGLFRFRNITPEGSRSTVPQKLYKGDKYLVTGYQGMTARLLPGTYTVRYHDPTDVGPARRLTRWHAIGPFPARSKKDVDLRTPYPPERNGVPAIGQGCTFRRRKYAWKRLERRQIDLRMGQKAQGVIYLATEIDSDSAREAELIVICREALKVWVNGKLLTHVVPARRFLVGRAETRPMLRKGKNLLLVKTFVRAYRHWPFTALLEDWRSYQVAVRDGKGAPLLAKDDTVLGLARKPLPAVEGIQGIVFCQVPNLPNGVCGLHPEQFRIVRRPKKARICSLIPAAPNGTLTDLTAKRFIAAMQPDLSYDGKKIVFTARKTNNKGDHWNVHEMNVDGSGLRQVTRGLKDCIDPCYLPNGRIVFSSNCSDFRDEYDRDVPPLLFTCEPDGSEPEQITFNLSSDTASVVLADGRVLFTSWQHHGEHQSTAGNFALCTVMPDGTGFNLFTGNAGRLSRTKSYAQQLTDGRVVFIETAGHRHYNAGYLSAVRVEKPLTTREILTPGVVLNGINTAGRYASPYPLPEGRMLVSFGPGRGTSRLRDEPFEDIHLGIYEFDLATGRPARLVFDDPDAQDYDAIAIYERPVPTVIHRMVFPNKKNTGKMVCVNAYLNDRPRQNRRAVVGELPPPKPGQIEAVRVVEGFGVHDKNPKKHRGIVIDLLQMSFGSSTNGGTAFEQKRILGYAPVEPDGSFGIEVPADVPISVQTLDANGMAINTQLTWTWVRPGETRLCVGCHESREMALPNLDCKALSRPAHFAAPPPEKRRTVDFRRDIMPIIERRCSSSKCHGLPTKAGGLDLRQGFQLVFHRSGIRGRKLDGAFFNHAYESLLQANANRIGRLVNPGAARHSPLIWRLYGKKLAHDDQRNPYKKPIKQMPPAEPLTAAEKKLFVEWVDLGAQWDNILGEDGLPGYDADQSRKLAKAAYAEVSKPIADGKRAFEVRCYECHDTSKTGRVCKLTPAKVPVLVRRMVAKRRTWIHTSEIPLIIAHIQKNCLKPAAKRK